MAKKSSKSSAKLAMTIAISIGGAALLAAFAGSLVVLLNLQGAIPESASEALQKGKLAARPLAHSRAKAFDVAPRVGFDNDASNNFTVIEVTARDRPALLNRLARAPGS